MSVVNVMYNEEVIGMLWPKFIDNQEEILSQMNNVHTFHPLTESNSQDLSFRTGYYTSEVTECINEKNESELWFNLLRCSTNFRNAGTHSFTKIDRELMSMVNKIREEYYPGTAELNHGLVQKYVNKQGETKVNKAVISRHSDKTKDMPENFVIAFLSFYESNNNNNNNNYIDDNLLSRLRFRSKTDRSKYEDMIFYPGSLLIIPASTNDKYTHEIKASKALIDDLPTRVSYTMRSSDQLAVFNESDNKTYILDQNKNKVLLEVPNEKQFKKIKDLYKDQNMKIGNPDYSEVKRYSVNDGDFVKPIVYREE